MPRSSTQQQSHTDYYVVCVPLDCDWIHLDFDKTLALTGPVEHDPCNSHPQAVAEERRITLEEE